MKKLVIYALAIAANLAVGVFAAVMLYVYWPEGNPGQQTPTPEDPVNPVRPAAKSPLEEFKGPKKGLRVLFVGNSHTFTNDLPSLVAKLAKAADEDRPLLAWAEAPGGTSLQMHWENGIVQPLLREVKWDLVVLQDQSSMPNLPRDQRDQQTLPFARKLDNKIKESGARTVLFMTWGYQQDFFPMQKRARDAYTELTADLQADLVPVGTAWEKAHKARPDLALWTGDGNHADIKGSYLTACVFYAVFYGKSPVGNSYTAGLDAADALFLQQTGASVVELQPGGLAAKAPGRAK